MLLPNPLLLRCGSNNLHHHIQSSICLPLIHELDDGLYVWSLITDNYPIYPLSCKEKFLILKTSEKLCFLILGMHPNVTNQGNACMQKPIYNHSNIIKHI